MRSTATERGSAFWIGPNWAAATVMLRLIVISRVRAGQFMVRRERRQPVRTSAMRSQTEKAIAFRALHERPGAFIIPNPWDAGTAKLLAALGFEALATTSLGLANMLGRADSVVTRAEVIENCRIIAAATDLPVNADLENCFAHAPDGGGRDDPAGGRGRERSAARSRTTPAIARTRSTISTWRWRGCARRPRSPMRCRCRSC